jgi:hypothetical protein
MINGKDGQAEGATRVHDDGMACANPSASAASSVTAASKQAGVGAVFIKKYSNYRTNQKKVPRGFSQNRS